jgi:hypothetical protein
MKQLKVELANQPSVIIKVRDNDSAETWLKDAGPNVVLNGISYRKEDIVKVSEYTPRSGSTNMEGI